MKTLKKYLFLCWFFFLYACKLLEPRIVQIPQTKYQTEGRVEKKDTAQVMYWSGTSFSVKFVGKELYAHLKDENGSNDIEVIIDQDSSYRLDLAKGFKKYLIANLPLDTHTVTLVKRTEYDRGSIYFSGFYADVYTQSFALPQKEKRIVFYGNSITAAYAVDDYSGQDSPDGTHTNCMYSYAYLTAKHYDASYQLICKSGIGITVSWVDYIAQDIYDKISPMDKNSVYDFKDSADVVLINLGQNDKWLSQMIDRPEHKRVFGDSIPSQAFFIDAYKSHVIKIRAKHPNSQIICALGSMDAARDPEWKIIVKEALKALNDPKTHYFEFSYINKDGHPKIEDHQKMSRELIQFLDKKGLMSHY